MKSLFWQLKADLIGLSSTWSCTTKKPGYHCWYRNFDKLSWAAGKKNYCQWEELHTRTIYRINDTTLIDYVCFNFYFLRKKSKTGFDNFKYPTLLLRWNVARNVKFRPLFVYPFENLISFKSCTHFILHSHILHSNENASMT